MNIGSKPMRHRTHLALVERESIMVLQREKGKITEIVAAIGCDKSTDPPTDRRRRCTIRSTAGHASA